MNITIRIEAPDLVAAIDNFMRALELAADRARAVMPPTHQPLPDPVRPSQEETKAATPPIAFGGERATPGGRLSEEQKALLRRDWPTGRASAAIAAQLGVRRPAKGAPPESPVPLARRPTKRITPWSPERLALLDREYPAGVSKYEIAAHVSALPGAAVTASAVKTRARDRGLKRAVHAGRPPRPKPAAAATEADASRPTAAQASADDDAPRMHFRPAGWNEIAKWAREFAGMEYDGGNLDAINKKRHAAKKLPFMLMGGRLAGIVNRFGPT